MFPHSSGSVSNILFISPSCSMIASLLSASHLQNTFIESPAPTIVTKHLAFSPVTPFFKELVDENTTWTFPGKEGVHPLSGVHKGPQAMMGAFSKIPEKWSNFKVEPIDMISEGNKVFVRVKGSADGMETMFGHYF